MSFNSTVEEPGEYINNKQSSSGKFIKKKNMPPKSNNKHYYHHHDEASAAPSIPFPWPKRQRVDADDANEKSFYPGYDAVVGDPHARKLRYFSCIFCLMVQFPFV